MEIPAKRLRDAAELAADLLAFHTARIADEGYLRTARDPRSLGLLGRLVDHRPRPGLAADTHLAYRLDPRGVPGGPAEDVLIPRGARSRSVPAASGDQPQTFETDVDLTARAAWNELPVRRHRPEQLLPGDLGRRPEILVAGTTTLLAVGDRLLFRFGTGADAERRLVPVARVRVDRDRDVTAIGLPTSPPPHLADLVSRLRAWITEPGPQPRPPSALIEDVDARVLVPLRAGLDGIETPEAFVALLAGPRERLAEAVAIAEAGPDRAAAEWLSRLAAVAGDLAAQATGLGGIRAETAAARAAPAGVLTDLIALRINALPFGAAAPLRPVRDGAGRVIALTDWPLPGATLTTTRIVYDTAGRVPLRAEFVHAQPEGTVQHAADLAAEPVTFDLGGGAVTVSATAGEVTVELRDALPVHRLAVSAPGADRRVTVTVDDQRRELAPGGREQLTAGGHEIVVGYAAATQPASLEIGVATVPDPSRRAVLPLDGLHPIAPGSPVVVERPGRAVLVTRAREVRTVSYAAYGITGRGTQLTLDDDWLDEHDVLLSQIRNTTVYAGGEPLRPAGEPITEDVHGERIVLADRFDGLHPGRVLAVTGPDGAEIVTVAAVEHDPHTTLTLAGALTRRYRRDTVHVLGNVVPASAGETVDEPVGDGDATAAHQTFTLWRAPLTWLPAPNPLGATPALEIRVDGLLWQPVESLAGRGPAERVYLPGAAPDGRTTITFGDGTHGARLPTGRQNVRARYRFGGGPAGNLPPGRITQTVTRPLGVIGVTNPVPATGGADPDGPGLARRRIPLAVSTLDRLVSVRDYAEFARARVGVGRAVARELSGTVHVTVVGVDDEPVITDSDLLPALRAALVAHGDPRLPVRVDVREPVPLRLVAGVRVAAGHDWALTGPRLRAALLDRLGYRGRELARDAYLSEVMAVADRTPGVDHVDVDVFSTVRGPAAPLPVVRARPARAVEERYRVTRPGGETLTEAASRAGVPLAELARLNPDVTGVGPLPHGRAVVTFRGIRPAQFAALAAGDLTLTEIR